jgi:hypothetical protein
MEWRRMSAFTRERDLRLASMPNAQVLSGLRLEPGIEAVEVSDESTLTVRYRLTDTTLSAIIRWLNELGCCVDARPLNRARLAVQGYMDAVQRQAMRSDSTWEADLRRLYISRQRNRHRRDERTRHWRKYLAREEGTQ